MFSRLLGIILGTAGLILAAIFALVFRPSEQQLVVTDQVISQLQNLRAEQKFLDLPGTPAPEERRRMEPLINDLLEQLIRGLPTNPKKTWVLSAMDPIVAKFHLEDTEVRERCVRYLERTLGILGISSTNGAFYKYFVFI